MFTPQRPINSGKDQLLSLIRCLERDGVPEDSLDGLFQELGHEVYRDELASTAVFDELNPNV